MECDKCNGTGVITNNAHDCNNCPDQYTDELVRDYTDAGITEKIQCKGCENDINNKR